VRRWLAAAVATLAALAVTGCSDGPAGADLTAKWPMIAAATPFRPAAGACHETLEAIGSADTYVPVSCTELHVSETFFVGTAPEAPVVPSSGSAPARQAYEQCSGQAETFLGGPWRGARVAVRVIWPSRQGWSGGSRWFRCDVTETDLDAQNDQSRTGSLAGALPGSSALLLGCFNPKVNADDVRTMTAVACPAKHKAEYVGTWTAPDIPYAEQTKDRTRTATGCRSVIAKYTGVPDDSDMQYRSGWISYNPTRAQWQLGERRVRCFLWFSDRTLTRSLKGTGPKALPVH
jgi:Septum formation